VGRPLDGYLALAHATVGDTSAARSAAERAEEQATTWGMTAYLDWFARRRADLGFEQVRHGRG
jgi:hypothetical protein